MKNASVAFIQITIFIQMAWAGELTAISSKFVTAAKDGDIENLASTLWSGGPAKREMIAEFKQVIPEIKEGKIKITSVDRELIIGELGVTLMRMDAEGAKAPHFNPIICLNVEGKWLIFPWTTEEHLKVLFKQRSKEEQIHLRLFNEWANLMEKLLTEEVEPAGAGQPNTDSALQATSPVDISGATSENALDRNVGKWVTFTGKWQNRKEGGLSNGHVFISPSGGSTYVIGSMATLTGYLTKVIVPVRHSQPSDRARQSAPPGNHYYIEKDPPARNSTEPTKAEPAGADQPATKPTDKGPVKEQP